MLLDILSRCDSMTEICEGLRAFGGKLKHLGLDKAPAKSRACVGLSNSNSALFEDLYFYFLVGFLKPEQNFFRRYSQNQTLLQRPFPEKWERNHWK
jgi:hypothetical protein